jgi:hypothetical protein
VIAKWLTRFVDVWARPSRPRFSRIAKQAKGETEQALVLILFASVLLNFGSFFPTDSFQLFTQLMTSVVNTLVMVIWVFVIYRLLGWFARSRKLNYEGLLILFTSIFAPLVVFLLVTSLIPSLEWVAYLCTAYSWFLLSVASSAISKLPLWITAMTAGFSLVSLVPIALIASLVLHASFYFHQQLLIPFGLR